MKNHDGEMETDNLLAATDTSLKNRCRLVDDVLIAISGWRALKCHQFSDGISLMAAL